MEVSCVFRIDKCLVNIKAKISFMYIETLKFGFTQNFGLFRIHFRQVSLYVFAEKSKFMVDNGVCLIFTDKKWGDHLVT